MLLSPTVSCGADRAAVRPTSPNAPIMPSYLAHTVLLALNDVDAAGAQVGQPLLKLLRPHQPQAGGHNHQQWPFILGGQGQAAGQLRPASVTQAGPVCMLQK